MYQAWIHGWLLPARRSSEDPGPNCSSAPLVGSECGSIPGMTDDYPRLYATTGRFTHGTPSHFTISPDDQRVVFLRSSGPEDPHQRLMVLTSDQPRVVADARALGADDANLSAQERARRERLREGSAGIVGYATDAGVTVASFAVGGAVGIADLVEGTSRLLGVTGPAVDPRVDPTGHTVAWVADRALWVSAIDGSDQRCLVAPESETESWGTANFLAAEEFDRVRGFWWSPDGQALLVEQFDEQNVEQWYISDPANPSHPAVAVHYPATGAANPRVRLWLVRLDGTKTLVRWDESAWEYVVSVHWSSSGPPLVRLYDRSQQSAVTLAIDPQTADTTELARDKDDAWVSDLPGTPRWDNQGRLVTTTRSQIETIAVDATAIDFGPGINASEVVAATERGLLVRIAPTATTSALGFVDNDLVVHRLDLEQDYVTGTIGSSLLLTISANAGTLEWRRELRFLLPLAAVNSSLFASDPDAPVRTVESLAMTPPVRPNSTLIKTGERELNTAILWPAGHVPGSGKLPVIMNPYGGPHAQRVLGIGRSYVTPQWMADQGYAVVVTDGRGSPGRGPAWERSIHHDLAALPLQDQVDSLQALLAQYPDDLDSDRVGITGWSFGGYLAALAVLARPDVFHCAIAGAPVTDWRLYDSAYTERYLGDPAVTPDSYRKTSLLPLAQGLSRPLMIIHGLSDDNVVVAHSLQLSAALTAAGRPHTMLPLSNVTHMTPQVEVAENLLRLQMDFFNTHLSH